MIDAGVAALFDSRLVDVHVPTSWLLRKFLRDLKRNPKQKYIARISQEDAYLGPYSYNILVVPS